MADEGDDFEDTPLDLPKVGERTRQAESGQTDCSSDDSDEDLKPPDEAPEFFDPDIDDKDAAWVTKQRQGRKSDAILSCPCCLTTLCIDCQQHSDLEGQFRAMFVMNCRWALKGFIWLATVRRWGRCDCGTPGTFSTSFLLDVVV
jgi:hypothetical protein